MLASILRWAVSLATGAVACGVLTMAASGPPVYRNHSLRDFDGDGKSDVGIVRRVATAVGYDFYWYIRLSESGTLMAVQFGGEFSLGQDEYILPADFNGDHRADVAVVRDVHACCSPFMWYSAPTGGGFFMATPWGGHEFGDAPLIGDYDGDGTVDLAVYRYTGTTGVFYVKRSSDGALQTQPWGHNPSGDIAMVGDFDGDGRTDFIVRRPPPTQPGTFVFYLMQSTAGFDAFSWGAELDIYPFAHDFNGDGKSDIGIIRPVEISKGVQRLDWYVRLSSGGMLATTWGIRAFDVPVPADYDGDGKTDFAIYRNAGSQWIFYILQSSNGALLAIPWGGGENLDTPLGHECFYSLAGC
jgi:hypothetical protein